MAYESRAMNVASSDPVPVDLLAYLTPGVAVNFIAMFPFNVTRKKKCYSWHLGIVAKPCGLKMAGILHIK